MKKRILSMICAFAIVLGMIIPSTGHVHAATDTTCDCGATDVTWETLTADTALESGKHYRLAGKVELAKQYQINTAMTVCFDLAGYTLSSPTDRAFLLGLSDGSVAVTVNITDSSAAKTGRVEGDSSDAASGGVAYLYSGAVMNVYGGTIATVDASANAAKIGAVFQLRGGSALNMYGGKIEGGTAIDQAGAVNVYKNATLNMQGGSITGGTAPLGSCVYAMGSSIIKLANDASIENIYFAGAPSASLTVSGTYTGKLGITTAAALSAGTVIGTSDSADISGASITVTGTSYAATVSGSSIIVDEGHWCEACQATVVWQSLSGALPAAASGHYRLTKNVSASQVSVKSNDKICLDLAGYTYTGTTRALLLGNSAGDYTVDLNIMDSSAEKTGMLQAYGSDAYTAGVIYVYKNTKLSLYSGTVQLAEGGSGNQGGVIATWSSSEVNLYGGKIVGRTAISQGGAIYHRSGSTLNVAGGSIEGGTAGDVGDCVYVASGGIVNLSGSGSVEQLYFAGSSADKLTITGNYTGKAELKFAATPAEGADIGNSSNASLLKENVTIADTRMCCAVSGSDLVAQVLTGTSVTDAQGNVTYYDTLAAAVAAQTKGSTVKLLEDNGEDVTISGDMTLDLYGRDLTGNVTVSGGTLYVKDSATDDYNVDDVAGYGVISGKLTGNVKAVENYLQLTEDAGLSFHSYVLKLTKVNLRPGNTGIYYSSDILVNSAVLKKIDTFGIAVSATSETPSADPNDTASKYTAFTAAQYGSAKATSVLINAVMDASEDAETNSVYAATMIYGCPYIRFSDGTYSYGNVYATSLQQLTEIVDEKAWTNLTLAQNRALLAMYDTYKTAMADWDLNNIQTSVEKAAAAADDRALKVLVIGNSHGLDATNLLYEVFKAEGLPAEYDDLILGAIYTGGCSVSTHAKNALNDLPYDYWKKNDGSTEDGAWLHTEDPTMREVLEDENWDIVLLQEMNTSSAREEYFTNDNIETVFTFVVNTLGYEPEFMWNMIWANPEIPESYVNYLYKDGDDGSGSEVGSGSEGDDNDTSDATTAAKLRAWIFQTQAPSALETWGKNYVTLWENNRQVMYNNIVSNVQNYVLAKDAHNINADEVMPNATAIQYAIEWMGMHEQDMYRDYTHISDLGRLTVAYLWYAKLTGKTSIDAPKYTLVSQVLENSRQPLGYAKDYSQYSDVIRQSVNFALADPYGVIQNLTYAEYLALTADEQAAYEASFEAFSVSSGWTFDAWFAQAVAGVTYTDYARMTDEQKTAYAALRDDFDTWYAGIVESLSYAEYFVMTTEEQTAYAALCGDAFETWLAKASAAFTYTDYVMLTYEQQLAYQATFAEGEFDTHYANWLANMTYEEYMGLTMHQKLQYRKTYSSIANFLVWYEAAKAAYEA